MMYITSLKARCQQYYTRSGVFMLVLGASYYSGCDISFSEFAELCSSLEMNFIEIQLEPPYLPDTMRESDVLELKTILESNNMQATIHAPYDDVNLSSLKESIRRASVEIFKQSVDIANVIDAEIVVVHAGTCPADQFMREDEARNRFMASILDLGFYAKEIGIVIGLENKQKGMDREIVLHPEEHYDYLSDLHDLGVSGVFDAGHANTVTSNLLSYLRKLVPYLCEVHLHDNDGIRDTHVGLGKGSVNTEEIVKELVAIDFQGPVILELKTESDIREGVEFIRDIEGSC